MKKLIAFVIIALAATGAFAETKRLLNLDKDGVAVHGYDPVAFFTQNNPVKGNPQFQSTYNGAKYYFASAESKKAFDSNPAKYEPQFGGYCAYGVSKNTRAPIEVDAFQIVDGRLLMQYDKSIRDKFNQDQQGRLKTADTNWPGLVDKYGK